MHESTSCLLPLSSSRIPPRQPTRVVARATEGALNVEHVKISGAATPGGSADWIVNDIEINGRSQLVQKDLPGALFGARGVVVGARSSPPLLLHGLDPVEKDDEFTLVVTYVGPNPEGVPFFACAVGAPLMRTTYAYAEGLRWVDRGREVSEEPQLDRNVPPADMSGNENTIALTRKACVPVRSSSQTCLWEPKH